MDFNHQFIETEKYDAKRTYKKFTEYSLGVAVIGDHIVGIENRIGNTNVRFCLQHTLERIFTCLEKNGIHIYRARMDRGSCSEEIVDTVKMEGQAVAFCYLETKKDKQCTGVWENDYTYR